MILCVRSSSPTGYMLVKVRHDLPEVGFVKVPRDDRGSIRVFVDVSAEHIVEFGQSQASVCLWGNVNGSNDDRWKLPGQIEWAADNGEMFQMRRAGTRQNGDAPGVTPFLIDHETHTPPPLVLPASAVLSIRKTEKLSDGLTALSGTEVVSHVWVKQRIVSRFPQSVADSSTFPAVFLSPPGIIQVAFVLLGVPKYLQWPRWICG